MLQVTQEINPTVVGSITINFLKVENALLSEFHKKNPFL